MRPDEKLRTMVKVNERSRNRSEAIGDHLRDADFIRLIENKLPVETDVSPAVNNGSSTMANELAPLRRHLLDCDSCLDQFRDFYAFFAPAQTGEAIAGKSEIDAAWNSFAPRIIEKKPKPGFLARLFPKGKKSDYFAAFGWAFAALMILFTGLAGFVAWEAKNENSQLAEQLEHQKQSSEELEKQKQSSEDRLKTLEQAVQNQNSSEQEKSLLATKRNELEKRVAALQTEIERAKQQKQTAPEIALSTNQLNSSTEKPDNSLVAVNTPIYDVFPGDAVVRSGNQSANKLVVPNVAKNVVLILNAAGRADFPAYEALLLNNSGKTVWRGGGLRKDLTGNFTLTISRSALKAGNYRVKLSSGSQAVAEYSIIIEIGK